MAEMSPYPADWVFVSEWPGDGGTRFRCLACAKADARHAFRAYNRHVGWLGRPREQPLRMWLGEVFFDHVRGVIDPAPKAGIDVSPAFLLVTHTAFFDWNGTDSFQVHRFGRAERLLERAEALVAHEAGQGRGVEQLWAVYGVRVERFRELSAVP